MWSTCASGRRTSTPTESSRSLMISTSAMRGTLRSTKRPSAMRLAAMSLRAEFFAPSILTAPSRDPLGRTMIRSTPSVSSETWPASYAGSRSTRWSSSSCWRLALSLSWNERSERDASRQPTDRSPSTAERLPWKTGTGSPRRWSSAWPSPTSPGSSSCPSDCPSAGHHGRATPGGSRLSASMPGRRRPSPPSPQSLSSRHPPTGNPRLARRPNPAARCRPTSPRRRTRRPSCPGRERPM